MVCAAVFYQRVVHEAQLAGRYAFAIQPDVGLSARFVCLVAVRLAPELISIVVLAVFAYRVEEGATTVSCSVKRSRFLVNTVGTPTEPSMDRPHCLFSD